MRTRSRTTLFLMELILMTLVFALATAVCLRVFVFADLTSENSRNLSNAALQAQSVAECWKASGGDLQQTAHLLSARPDGQTLRLLWDQDWQEVDSGKWRFLLILTETELKCAKIEVRNAAGERIFSLDAVKAVNHGNE